MDRKTYFSELKGSALTEESWKGSVQSIYSKAVNLLHPSGILISIVISQDQMTDYGMVIANFSSFCSCISTASQFYWKGNLVIFPKIVVDLSNAPVWSGNFEMPIFALDIDFILIKQIFSEYAVEEGLSPLVTNKAGNIYSGSAEKIILKAVENSYVYKKKSYIDISMLIGLGPGFTPSGDDFITGVLLFEAISGHSLIDRKAIGRSLHRTTSGGRTLLMLSLQNSFPFYLKHFIESISISKLSALEAVGLVLKHGFTSGSDSLSGFIWASELEEKYDNF